jgi:hypothetical protein
MAQIRDHVPGQVAVAAVGDRDRPDAAKQRGGLVGGEIQFCATGNQIS